MAGGTGEQKSLEQTPTWTVAVVCTVFVIASLLVERLIHRLGQNFKKAKKKELFHTLEQIKNELMILGFISLFLTVFQNKIASICISESLNSKLLPCPYRPPVAEAPVARRRRLLATEAVSQTGCKAGFVPVISVEGLHQLHIFIFVLAIIHVIYSCITVLVGVLQVHSWKKWELDSHKDALSAADDALDTKHTHHQFAQDRVRYKFLHTTVTGLNLDSYIYSFFRQFGKPIYRSDYLSLRLGFIAKHRLPVDYDFHSYIGRAMEDDFKHVVGISIFLWGFVCLFLLLDLDGWYTYFWIAFIPTILVLIVGAKLQHIILTLAIDVRGGVNTVELNSANDLDDSHKDEETLDKIVKPVIRDDLFWFDRPTLLLKLIHVILFQNAFELAFFFWAMFTFGFNSCLVGKRWMILVRLGMGVFVQVLCSASTLPLYALVSQMGSNIKLQHAFSETTRSGISKWLEKAVKSSKPHPKPKEKLHSKPKEKPRQLAGIVGINKEVDEQGRARSIELPQRGTQHGHKQHPHPHGHHQHPHPPHHEGSHVVEINDAPDMNIRSSASNTNSENASSVPNIFQIAAAKMAEKKSGSTQNDSTP